MTPEIEAYQREFGTDATALFYREQALKGAEGDFEKELTENLQSIIEKYKRVPVIDNRIASSSDIGLTLKTIFSALPAVHFILIDSLSKNPDNYQRVLYLQFAAIIACTRKPKTPDLTIDPFHNECDSTITIQRVNEKIRENSDTISHFPMVVYENLTLLAKSDFTLNTANNLHRLIESLFYFKGITQLFLKYYLELSLPSKNDAVASNIDSMFNKLFISIKLKEITFWKGYKNSVVLKSRLSTMIEQNLINKRHPKLQKNLFVSLANMVPMLHDGKSRKFTRETQSLLNKQIEIFSGLSIPHQTLILNIVTKMKGTDFTVYLLARLYKADKKKLDQLRDSLAQSDTQTLEGLRKLVDSFTDRFNKSAPSSSKKNLTDARANGLLISSHTKREIHAKKRLAALKNKKGMLTHDKITRFLEERLKKIYEKVRMKGALTLDKVPEYLARFAAVAEPLMNAEAPQKKLVEVFEESTIDIINDFSKNGDITEKRAKEMKDDVREKVEELRTPDTEKRAEVVEEIGMALTNAVSPHPKPTIDLKKELVTIGFDKKSPSISLKDFLTLPLAPREGPNEENWFDYHLRYLELVIEKNKMDPSILDALREITPDLPKIKYVKYFDLFSNNRYEETTLFAIYDMWTNNAVDRLKAS